MKENLIYVFSGENSIYPSGIFTTKEMAIEWIKKYRLSGTLNEYPINIGLYDWAIQKDYFTVKNENQTKSKFIGTFTCASIEHWHFENGNERL